MKQLEAIWSEGGDAVIVSRDGMELIRHPVTLSRRTHSWLKPNGNGKLSHFGKHGMGVVNFLRNGCFRKATGCERCDEHCYREEGMSQSGCFAFHTAHAMLRWKQGFSIIENGLRPGTEAFFVVHQPKDGNYDLSMYAPRVWRVDSESSTSCLSLALGLTQRLAEANPGKMFCGISSDYFRVSDHMLDRAAATRQISIGHTLSPWFGVSDIQNRIAAARRFSERGLSTTLWVISRPDWEERNPGGWKMIVAEMEEWDPRAIIRLGYHDRSVHEVASDTSNPWGVCCRNGVDKSGRYVDMATRLRLDDGGPADGEAVGSCHKCTVACGATWLQVGNRS